MGNPIITRLGIQQFWYHHWYSDKNVSSNLQHDYLFEKLLFIYLKYGLKTQDNFFAHQYWYTSRLNIKLNSLQNLKHLKTIFYRKYYYLNDVVGIEHSFLMRNTTPEYFPLKLWVFKFNNWIILSIVWFKPLKGRYKNKTNLFSASAANLLHKPSSFYFKNKRLKLLLSFFF